MTNEQKYKTAEERFNAFHKKCGSCGVTICDRIKVINCLNNWLALKAEEKPEPCPFCGKEVVVGFSENIHKEKYRQVWCSDGERCGYECVMKKTEEEAIAAHNRVYRAVEAAEKKSVTDCNHLGNAAKMREALKQIYDRVNSLNEECAVDPVEIRDIARDALAASPRNCDAFSKDEVLKVLDDRSFSKEDTIEWLYEEAKGEVK